MVLIEFFLCPSVPCLERLASTLFVWRKLKVTQNWLCCCHSQIGFAVAILLLNGILVTFLLWSLKTSFCRSSVFHCDASAPVSRIMLRSVSKLRGIFGVAEQQGTLRGTSFTEHESQRLVCTCVCNGRRFLPLLCKCDLFKITPLCNSYVDPYVESQEWEVLPCDWKHSMAAFFVLGILYNLSQMRLCSGVWDRKFYILQLLIGCFNEAGYLALLIICSRWKEEKRVTRKQNNSSPLFPS